MSIGRPAAVAAFLAVVLAACSTSTQPSHGGRPGPTPSGHGAGSNDGMQSSGGPGPTPTSALPRHLVIRPAGFALPSAVQREVAVRDGGDVLVAGGLGTSGSSTGAVVRLTPGTGAVAPAGEFGTPFHDAAAGLFGGRLVVFGGGPSSGTDLVQAQPGGVIGHLPTVSSDLSAAAIGGRVLLVGGYDGSNFLDSVLATTDGTTFRQVATLPEGLRYAAVAAAGPHAVIVAGGLSTAGPVATILRITVPGGKVTAIGKLPRPLAHAAAVELGGGVFVLGGEDASGQTVRTVERVDPATGAVRMAHPLPGTAADAAAVALGPDRGLLIGGRRGPQGADVPLDTILDLRLA